MEKKAGENFQLKHTNITLKHNIDIEYRKIL